MEPVSVLLPVAKAILAQAGKQVAGAALTRIAGVREHKALASALGRAFAQVERDTGHRFSEFDVNPGFWEHEGAAELAKALIPGVKPSPAALAEAAVGSLGKQQSADDRLGRVIVLLPVFQSLLAALAEEIRTEQALQAFLGRSDAADTAIAASGLLEHFGAAPATEDDRVRYLRWVIDQHRYLHTAGMVRSRMVQLPLSEVFVGLQAQRDRHPGDRAQRWYDQECAALATRRDAGELDATEFDAAMDRLQVQAGRKLADRDYTGDQVTPVLDSVRGTAQLLVLGDPGSGKTTLLRFLALTHARALIAGEPVQAREARFPIYLRIGDYARQGYPSAGISAFLPDYLRRLECRAAGISDLLRKELDAGRCLILLDGLDEVASAELRRGVVNAVINFVNAYARQGNRFLVTSRIAGYHAAPLPGPFHAVRLQDMDDPTIERFLDVYCREVERTETPGKTDPAIVRAAADEAAAIHQALRSNPGVRRLAANPLLLTALVLVHRASGRLPHRRVEAYIEVCTALGRTWRSAQGVAEADLPDERILDQWLTELGSWLHANRPEGAASRLEMLEVLGPLWAEHQGVPWDPAVLTSANPLGSPAGTMIAEFAAQADEHTGLLVERSPGRYGFAHLTFEEYYTGRALALLGSEADRVARIRRRLHDPRYEEPILLALGLIGTIYSGKLNSVVAEAIHPAAHDPSPYEEILGRDFLFLLRVLADDPPLPAATIDQALHRAISEYADGEASRCRIDSYRKSLTDRLAALEGTRSADRFLAALDSHRCSAGDVRAARWSELARIAAAMGPLRQATVDALTSIVVDSADAEVRTTAAEALAAGSALSPSTTGVVIELATGEVEPALRSRLVSILAAGDLLSGPVAASVTDRVLRDPKLWGHRETVRTLARAGEAAELAPGLVRIAETTSDLIVRWRAVDLLNALSEVDPAAEIALLRLIEEPVYFDVSGRAVIGLDHRTELSGPVLETLGRVATGDGDRPGRFAALRVLAGRGLLTTSIIETTLRFAGSDANPGLRATAISALAGAPSLPGPAVAGLATLATDDADGDVRVAAAAALARHGPMPAHVTTMLVQMAGDSASPANSVRAANLLRAGGRLTEPVKAMLLRAATGDVDALVRVDAAGALVAEGMLTEPVLATALELAESSDQPELQHVAMIILGAADVPQPSLVGVVKRLATSGATWEVRRAAVRALGSAPAEQVAGLLTSAFLDADNEVRRAAGEALVEISRRQPVHAAEIQDRLAAAITDPRFGVREQYEHRTGWEYAFDALRRLVAAPAAH